MKFLMKFMVWVIAVALGVFLANHFARKSDQNVSEPSTLESFDFGGLHMIGDDQLLVVNVHVEGSEASENLAEILARIEANQTFGNRVIVRQVSMETHSDYARQNHVELTHFRGHLDFFSKERQLKPLKHIVEEQVVLDQIQAYLDGLIRRFDREWRPPVPGMDRGNTPDFSR